MRSENFSQTKRSNFFVVLFLESEILPFIKIPHARRKTELLLGGPITCVSLDNYVIKIVLKGILSFSINGTTKTINIPKEPWRTFLAFYMFNPGCSFNFTRF